MELYLTRDFNLAAYLMSQNQILRNHEKSNGKTDFYFDDNDRIKELVTTFYTLNGNVEPINYASKMRILKSIIHSSSYTYQPTNEDLNNDFANKIKGNL